MGDLLSPGNETLALHQQVCGSRISPHKPSCSTTTSSLKEEIKEFESTEWNRGDNPCRRLNFCVVSTNLASPEESQDLALDSAEHSQDLKQAAAHSITTNPQHSAGVPDSAGLPICCLS